MARYFLGLDSSTQSLSSILIDLDSGAVVDDRSLNFDTVFPRYGTQNGVLRTEDPAVVHSSPLMWLDALNLLFQQLKDDGLPLGEVLAISGSGQQHGSVYLTSGIQGVLEGLDPSQDLSTQIEPVLSRPTCPVWMDSSTADECTEIRNALGGMQAVVAASGSDCFERFTGSQIRRFAKREPAAYANTDHIALVSSFMSGVLAGGISPIDPGDGAGMNLMDLSDLTWHEGLVAATADDLTRKLPPIVASSTVLGTVSAYFVQRYGMNPGARVTPWSGDNPCSLIGAGLVEPGMMAISLGTSDTMFGAMGACRTDPRGEGHVFGSPAGGYMSLLCFKNGSLAREKIRDAYQLDWKGFSDALSNTPPGNDGKLILPYFEPEIVPRVPTAGVHRKNLSEEDAAGNVRAVVEAQMMSMRIHSEWMGERPTTIYATGGASVDREILRIMANVHQVPVYQFESTNTAALGAALRAAQAWCADTGAIADWNTIVAEFSKPLAGSRMDPDPETGPVYAQALEAFAEFEGSVL